MALFNLGKKEKETPKKSAPSQTPAVTETVPKKPVMTADEKNKLAEYPLLQRKVKDLEKRNKLAENEINEHEDYLRSVMEGYHKANKSLKFADKEIEEHEEYLRKIMQDLMKVQKQARFQEKEIAEQEQYLRRIMEDLVSTKKSYKFAEQEISEHEEYLRKIMQDLTEANRKNKFAEQEIAEHEEYLRKILEDYTKLNKSYKHAEKEIEEHEDYLRRIMTDLTSTNKRLKHAENEIKEQEDHVRSILKQLNTSNEQKAKAEQEIAEQEKYIRQVMSDYNATKKDYDRVKSELTDKESAVNSEYQKRIQAEQQVSQLQSELKESVKAFNQALPYVELDAQGNVLSANKLFLDSIGNSLTDIKGRNDKYFFDLDAAGNFEYDRLWNKVQGGITQTAEFKRVQDASEKWIKASYTPVLDFNNRVVKIIKVERDITRERKVEGTLIALETASRNVNLHFEIDGNGKFIYSNALFSEAMGFTALELKSKNLRDLVEVSPEDFYAFENFWRIISRGEGAEKSIKLKDNNNRSFIIEGSFQPVFDINGELERIVCLAKNKKKEQLLEARTRELETELISVESRMSEREQLLKGYLKGIDRTIGFIEYDMNGNIIHANDYFLNIFGYSLHEVKNAHHRMFVDTKYTKNYSYIEFWNALKEGRSQAGHYKRVNRQGETLYVSSTYTPVKDDEGEIVSVIEFVNDVTDQTLMMNKFIEYIEDMKDGKPTDRIDFNKFNLFAKQNQEEEKLDALYKKLSDSLNSWEDEHNFGPSSYARKRESTSRII